MTTTPENRSTVFVSFAARALPAGSVDDSDPENALAAALFNTLGVKPSTNATIERTLSPSIDVDQLQGDVSELAQHRATVDARVLLLEHRLNQLGSAVQSLADRLDAPSRWFMSRLLALVALQDGWDGEGSRPVSARAAETVLSLSGATLRFAGEPEPVARRDGGAQLIWTLGDDRFLIQTIHVDGSLGVLSRLSPESSSPAYPLNAADVERLVREWSRG